MASPERGGTNPVTIWLRTSIINAIDHLPDIAVKRSVSATER
jgi:hypothetical protein